MDDDGDVDLQDFQRFQNAGGTAPRIAAYSNSGCSPGIALGTGDYPDCGNDEVEFTVARGMLHLLHRNATYNCCFDDITVSLERVLEGGGINRAATVRELFLADETGPLPYGRGSVRAS